MSQLLFGIHLTWWNEISAAVGVVFFAVLIALVFRPGAQRQYQEGSELAFHDPNEGTFSGASGESVQSTERP